MKAILIIAHHCILPGAYKGFEEILDKLHHDLPGTRVASTSLLDLENDLRTLLREDVESVTPYLLFNGQHSKNDVPRVVAKLQEEFPQIPITLLPCLGDWKEFADMVVAGIRNAQIDERTPADAGYRRKTKEKESSQNNLSSLVSRLSSNSSLFSIEVNLEGKNVLVVGGGRLSSLRQAQGRLFVSRLNQPSLRAARPPRYLHGLHLHRPAGRKRTGFQRCPCPPYPGQ